MTIYFTFNYSLSGATKYCPLSHKLSAEMSCKIVYDDENLMIIRHCLCNSHSVALSMRKNKKTSWLLNPADSTILWDESIMSQNISYDSTNANAFFIDSIKVPLILVDKLK